MTDRKSMSTDAARFFAIRVDWMSEAPRRPGSLLVALALAAFLSPLGGCSGDGSGAGEGTVDISRAKDAARSNPDLAKSKAAAALGGGGIGDAQKGAQKKGRR
jgi:hypothetical protein